LEEVNQLFIYEMKKLFGIIALTSLMLLGACGEDEPAKEIVIVLKEHKFTPEVLEVQSGERFRLVIDNQDPTAEEFESHDMKREKIIKGNTKSVVFVGSLKAGEYKYFGEFNEDEAIGKIIAH
jgi:hypothetical protein